MNPTMQPSTPPAQPSGQSPTPQHPIGSPQQPPIMGVVQPPRKKKTGLIIGIVAGVVALIAIIVTVVLVVVLGNDPQKTVANALANFVEAEQVQLAGTMKVDSAKAKVTTDIKLDRDGGSGKAELDITIEGDDIPGPVQAKLSVIHTSNDTMFVKVGKLRELVDKLIDGFAGAFSQGQQLTPEQKAMVRQMVIEGLKQQGIDVDAAIKLLDDQWLRIAPGDVKEMMKSSSETCSPVKAMELFRSDDSRKEIAEALRKQQLMLKKDVKIDDRNGGKGFEFDLSSKPEKNELADTALGRFMRDCNKEADSSSSDDGLSAVRIWVNTATQQVSALEMRIKDSEGKGTVAIQFDVTVGKSDAVSEPSGARSLEDVKRQLNLPMGGGRPNLSIGPGGFNGFSI
ncbi:MAG: hypothetical protein Q4A37_00140 [Candidatus Saccharibacteria bacterium]|nr:hypothetical protein [Candidatus Saccharibacteria bacterium]